MNCDKAASMIYLYDKLSDDERANLDQHLQTCATCTGLYQKTSQQNNWIKLASTAAHAPAHSTNLTYRIMSSIRPVPRVNRFASLIDYFNHAIVRYSLSAISVILVILFLSEYSHFQDNRLRLVNQKSRQELNAFTLIPNRFPSVSKRNSTRIINAWLMASITIDREQLKFATRYLSDDINPVQTSYHQVYQCLLQCREMTSQNCNLCKQQWIKLK